MSAKRLLPLVALLCILIGLAVWNKRQPEPPPLSTALGLVRLLPGGVTPESISALDLYRGDQTQEVIRLRRQDGTWVLHSHFNAPTNAATLQAFLVQLADLQGELRSDHAEVLKDYQLANSQALHLLVYTDKPETPIAHLLAGKGSGRHGFMRRTNDTHVYAVDMNVRAQAGIAVDADASSPLSARPWAELSLIDVPQGKVRALELQTPTMHLRLVRQPTAPQEPSQENNGTWVVEQPAGGFAARPDAVNRLLTSWRTLKAATVASPVADAAAYGLDPAPYRGTLTMQQEPPEPRTVLVGNTLDDATGQRYYLRQSDHAPVYLVPSWTRDSLFPALGTLVDLRVVPVATHDITAFTLHAKDNVWQLERHHETAAATTSAWRLVATPDVVVEQTAITTFLEALTSLSADDLLVPMPAAAGDASPEWRLLWTQQDGQSRQLTLTHSGSGETEPFYARLDGVEGAFVLSASSQQQLLTAMEALHPRTAQ